MSNIKDLSYTILKTADDSPTLLLPESQPMHSLEGAFSETMEIYGPVAEAALQLEKPRLLSLGLGLGYNEILTATIALKISKKDWSLNSFESLPQLIQYFKAWVGGQPSPLNSCYDQILVHFSERFSIEAHQIKKELLRVNIHGALDSENETGLSFHGIFYDAFSNTTDPQLWAEEHLDAFLKNYCAENCYLSTYASTGALKRSLKKNEFAVQTKKGFGKKRESIFAERQPTD